MRLALALCTVLLAAGCAGCQAPASDFDPGIRAAEIAYADYECGGFTRSSGDEGYDLAVTVDSVSVSANGLLYVAGSSGFVGGLRWVGIARFVGAFERTPVPTPPTNGWCYGHDGVTPARSRDRPLAPDAIANYDAVVLDGRFELRAPLAEVSGGTLGVFYEGGAS